MQPLALVRDRVGGRAEVDEDVVAVELDREAAQLVRELVERAARARSKRAWCQWHVRIPSQTVPRWSGKPMCGQRLSTACTSSPSAKRQMRVAIDVHDQPAGLPQLGERRRADEASVQRRRSCVLLQSGSATRQPRTSSNVEVKCRGELTIGEVAAAAASRLGAALLRGRGPDRTAPDERQPAALRARGPAADRGHPGRARRRHPARADPRDARTLPTRRTPTRRDWERLSRRWRERSRPPDRDAAGPPRPPDTCIGCGCLSIDACALLNPDDEAAALGGGAHYLERDRRRTRIT